MDTTRVYALVTGALDGDESARAAVGRLDAAGADAGPVRDALRRLWAENAAARTKLWSRARLLDEDLVAAVAAAVFTAPVSWPERVRATGLLASLAGSESAAAAVRAAAVAAGCYDDPNVSEQIDVATR